MKTVIIRDDDIGAFTDPAMLETIYQPLWDAGQPVCLGTIPAQRSDVRVLRRPGAPYDPSIAVSQRGQPEAHPISNNTPLIDFLREKTTAGLAEVCLHGYEHRYMEFMSGDDDVFSQRLQQGKSLLQSALPEADIHSFIAPYDRVSAIAFQQIINAGFNFCIASEMLTSLPGYAHIGTYEQNPLPGGRSLYTCDEYIFTHRDDPQKCLATARERLEMLDLLVIANHYWMFFYDWQEVNTAMLAAWHTFVDELITRDDVRITTFAAG